MTAFDDARAALNDVDNEVRMRNALEALIAEHESMTAELGLWKTTADIRREAYVEVREDLNRLTSPPTDDEREALKQLRQDVQAVMDDDTMPSNVRSAQVVMLAMQSLGGPVTAEWEYEHLTRYAGEYVSTWRPCGPNAHGTKRRRRPAGPWEDVPGG